MNAKRTIVFIAWVTILVGLSIALRQAMAARHWRAKLAPALSEQSALRRQASQLDRDRRRLIPKSPRSEAGPPGNAATGPTAHPLSSEEAARAQLRRIRAVKAATDIADRSLFIRLGLNSNQIEEAERLMGEFSQRIQDIMAGAGQQDEPLSDPGIGQLAQSAQDQFYDQLAALLGADGFAQFQQLNRVAPAAAIVTQLAAAAFHSGSPITAVQGDQLTQIIASTSPDYKNGGNVNPNTVDWNAVQAQAQSVFSAQQLSALQNANADRLNRNQLRGLTAALSAAAP